MKEGKGWTTQVGVEGYVALQGEAFAEAVVSCEVNR